MFRKLRTRTNSRREAKFAPSSHLPLSESTSRTPSDLAQDPSASQTPTPNPGHDSSRQSGSFPHITRSPSLPHPSQAASLEQPFARARTDVGTNADTSVSTKTQPDHNPHPVSKKASTDSNPALVHHHHLLDPTVLPETNMPFIKRTASTENTLTPTTPACATSTSNPKSSMVTNTAYSRRLSLDGDIPSHVVRPDDNRGHDADDNDPSEGVVKVFENIFLPTIIDIAGSSRAGWEPVRGPVSSVPQTHTVEVRKENQDAYCAFAPFSQRSFNDDTNTDALEQQPSNAVNGPHITSTSPLTGTADLQQTEGPFGPTASRKGPMPRQDHQIFLGVFDGHGAEGRPVAQYVRDYIAAASHNAAPGLALSAYHNASPTQEIPTVANASLHRARLDTLRAAFSRAERALTESDSGIDHVFSGTTAVVTWLFGREMYTAWTGDSRCVIGRRIPSEHGRARFKAVDLSYDQKPLRADEKRRVKAAGGRIARWQRNTGPLRVWLPRDWTPGLAMTRSIGDTVLSEYGVSPVPEVSYVTVGPADSFLVLASDGVWEFMTSQEVVDFVGRMRREGSSARDACEGLVREAVRRWRRNEMVVDDTTAVVMYMKWEDEAVPSSTEEEGDRKGGIHLLAKSKKLFSRARVSLKSPSSGVYLVTEYGELVDFVCKNDAFHSHSH